MEPCTSTLLSERTNESFGDDDLSGSLVPDHTRKDVYSGLVHVNIEHSTAQWFLDCTVDEMSFMLSCASNAVQVYIDFGSTFLTYSVHRHESHLENLYNHSGHYGALKRFATALNSQWLHTLRLKRIVGQEEDYILMLDKHRTTLRNLTVQECGLCEEGKWSNIMRWIKSNLTLDHFEVSDLGVETRVGTRTVMIAREDHRSKGKIVK